MSSDCSFTVTSFTLPGFSAYHSVSTRTSGGGVTVLVDSCFESNLNADLFVSNKDFESVGLEVKINNETYSVFGVYRPPSNAIPHFNRNFFQLINSISSPYITPSYFSIDIVSTITTAAGINCTDRFSCLGYDPPIITPAMKTLLPQPV